MQYTSKNKTVFFKKEGRRYIPVSEYDNEFLNAIPYDCAILELKKEHSTMRRYKVDPATAPLTAAAMILEDKLCEILNEASKFVPEDQKELTAAQQEAWQALGLKVLYGPSQRDVAEKILKAITAEAEKLLTHPALKDQYEQFLFLSKLLKEKENA